jgi:NCAIR mutase (PurE)-related protein
MNQKRLRELLNNVKNSSISVGEALDELSKLPFADIGEAVVDHHRALRTGFPEVVLGDAKSADQIARIVKELQKGGHNVLVTRVGPDKAADVCEKVEGLKHMDKARALVFEQEEVKISGAGAVSVVTAGTSDIPIAEEAALTAELAGSEVRRMFDVGVAGIHRLFHRLDELRSSSVIVVVAGMEGALASVVGGLVPCPVIAVPTSIGYGASFGGIAALLGMLNSCAAGVTVVNIDNGFGAGYFAALINRVSVHPGESK